jgi:hypothetical protein
MGCLQGSEQWYDKLKSNLALPTHHCDKFNFVSDIGQNNTAINFITAIWQNSNQLCYSYLAEQKSKFPTNGCDTTVHFVTAIWQNGS